jgi:hypothetical protein
LLKNSLKSRIRQVYLDEANVLGVSAEALPAAQTRLAKMNKLVSTEHLITYLKHS